MELGELVGLGASWQNRLETALHDKAQELGRPLTEEEEADLRRQAASPNNRQRSKSRNATLFRFTRGEIGVDTVLEEVVEDSISRDMERTGRGMPFYVDSIRQMEKELGKDGAFLADKPSYTKQDIIEAVGKMVRGKVLADTAKPNNGLSDWVNDFLSLVRKWVNEVVAMVKLGDAVNKVLSDPKARERLGDEFVNMVEDLAHRNTEFMRGLQRDATLRYTMEAATRKANPTPTLTAAMEKHGAQVREETEERERRHKALSDDIAAANAIMDGEEPAAPQEPATPAETKQEPAHPVDELTQEEETRAWGRAIYNKARSDRGRRKALDMVRIAPQLRESGVDVTTEAGTQKAADMAEYAARCREQLEARAQKPQDEETQARVLATLMGWERWHELGELVDEASAWDGKKRVTPKLIEVPKEGNAATSKGGSTDISFSVSTTLRDDLTEAWNNKMKSKARVKLCSCPDVFLALGLQEADIVTQASTVSKLRNNHKLSIDDIEKAVSGFNNPVLIFRDSTKDDIILFPGMLMLNKKGAQGDVMAAIKLERTPDKKHYMASLYPLDGLQKIEARMKAGDLLYSRYTKTALASNSNAPELSPELVRLLVGQGFTSNTITEEDVVKWKDSQNRADALFFCLTENAAYCTHFVTNRLFAIY